MATEIVRLLRWRAEWDGADLTDGATKAAAAGERLKKTIEDVGTSAPPSGSGRSSWRRPGRRPGWRRPRFRPTDR